LHLHWRALIFPERGNEGHAMWILILGLVVFFAIHSVRMAAGGFRDRQIAISPRRWTIIYTLVSVVGLGLIIWGWVLYRPGVGDLYAPPDWGRHVAMVLVWAAFVLVPAAYLPPGRIKAAVKHPFLAGVALWAFAHLLSNGDLASVSVFGAFLAFTVVNRLAVSARSDPDPVPVKPRSDVIAVLAGTAVYLVFVFWLHRWLFGVSPIG
jgi:uncharacterized membrane protein